MTQHLKAIYEDGVFRPLEPVRLAEHQEVTLVLERPEPAASSVDADKPIWEVATDLAREIPMDATDALPTDGAAQHDHYLYAAPKRD
jgi:predicted DNA-binding antitoxin AbrB/MazE fold protein